MKNTTIFFLLLFGLRFSAEAQKINFIDGNLSDALILSREQDKPVFVDAYAVWCGPCKRMDKEVFTNMEVAQYFNANYISIKIDMEKGEGPVLSEIYGVRAYPTFLFLDGEGEIIHKIVGFYPADAFLNAAKIAGDPEKQMAGYEKKYAAGERSSAFLLEYYELLEEVYDPSATAVLDQYLQILDNWETGETRSLIFNALERAEGPYWEHFVSNKNLYREEQGEEAYEMKIFSAVLLQQALADKPQVEQARKTFDLLIPERAHLLELELKMDLYRRSGNHEAFARTAIERHKEEAINNPYLLNNIAWEFYTNINDKKLLKQGVALAEASVNQVKLYSNLDTLAALYHKLKKKKKAKKYAKEAILIARESGEDYSETQERVFGNKALTF